ncbi:Protein of unknown function DUF4228 [Macleaya cordata]|uniref:Uncharacterized protein n=1 Tax=Macleaya cordata TaxID=56857 RepID=A0A200Q477_MACCD|nr:Protein of unknown function DUF4228 [Macleaya cordata]
MGICSSCESTSVATAKLILQDGQLQEFTYPVKVSYVLQKHPTSFICNSDDMDFDDFVSAINADEELQLGQLYFLLPLRRLKQPLQAEDLAALAVMASSALMKSSCGGGKNYYCKCRRKGVPPPPVMFSSAAGDIGGGGSEVRTEGKKKRRPMGGFRGRNFASNLSAIAE